MVTFQQPGLIVWRGELAFREGFPLILEDHLVEDRDGTTRMGVAPSIWEPRGDVQVSLSVSTEELCFVKKLPQQASYNLKRLRGLLIREPMRLASPICFFVIICFFQRLVFSGDASLWPLLLQEG